MRIGKYILVEKLSRRDGVWLAYAQDDHARKNLVAIKRLPPEKERSSTTHLLPRAHHPVLLSYKEVVHQKGTDYLVMEYFEGISLERVLDLQVRRQMPLRLDLALWIATQVSAALEYLHLFVDPGTRHILPQVHGDVSPRNILIGSDGSVKLIGLVFKSGEADMFYASPSRAFTSRADAVDDLFGLGVWLWELCTGARYWRGHDAAQVKAMLNSFSAQDPRVLRSDLSADVCHIIMNCLNTEGFRGYALSTDLHDDLQRALDQQDGAFAKADLGAHVRQEFSEATQTGLELQRKVQEHVPPPMDQQYDFATTPATLATPVPLPNAAPAERVESPRLRVKKTREPATWERFLVAIAIPLFLEGAFLAFASYRTPGVWLSLRESGWTRILRYLHLPPQESERTHVLRVASMPPGARIRIDGQQVEGTTPAPVQIKLEGLSLIEVEGDGGRGAALVDARQNNVNIRLYAK